MRYTNTLALPCLNAPLEIPNATWEAVEKHYVRNYVEKHYVRVCVCMMG